MTYNFNLKACKEQHPYHLVENSPYPFFVALSALLFTLSFVTYMSYYKNSLFRTHLSFFFLILFTCLWFENIVRESSLEGHHTLKVQHGLRIGVTLFITSEVFFFFSFF
jgi:hypothetical protein